MELNLAVALRMIAERGWVAPTACGHHPMMSAHFVWADWLQERVEIRSIVGIGS